MTNLQTPDPHPTFAQLVEQIHDDLDRMIEITKASVPPIGPRGVEVGVVNGDDIVSTEQAYWAGFYDGREALRAEQQRADR